jgi:hypothetical protein
MLQVFETAEERSRVYDDFVKSYSYDFTSYPSGISPPTYHIVKRKYSKTRREKMQPVSFSHFLNFDMYSSS